MIISLFHSLVLELCRLLLRLRYYALSSSFRILRDNFPIGADPLGFELRFVRKRCFSATVAVRDSQSPRSSL